MGAKSTEAALKINATPVRIIDISAANTLCLPLETHAPQEPKWPEGDLAMINRPILFTGKCSKARWI